MFSPSESQKTSDPSGCKYFFFTVYFWNNAQHALNYQSQLKQNPLPFLSGFSPSHSNALINQTHLQTSEESGMHKDFSVFTIPHLCALAAQCHSSENRQQSTDWFSPFNCIPAKTLLGRKQKYRLRFFLNALTQAYLSEIKSPANSLLQLLFPGLW